MLATPDLIEETVQQERLAVLLPRWLDQVPLYRGQTVPGAGGRGTFDLVDSLARLPLITKADIRHGFPHNFLRAGVELEALLEAELVELEQTSGTSEERTALLLERGWWTVQEERALRLNRTIAALLDEFPQARRVAITSPVCNNDICYTGRPSRHDRIVGHALHVNLSRHPFFWSDADLDRMAQETLEWQPHFLDVDPVYGVLFARHCEQQGLRFPSLRFVLSSYEFLSLTHRRCLERAFGVPVFNLYGATETGHLLMENERGELLPSGETAHLELFEPDRRGIGELVVTTLTNDYMPLIRYRIGDLAEQQRAPYRTTYRLHGRVSDACQTPAGARVTPLEVDRCFTGLAGIIHYQLARDDDGGWSLQVIADATGPTPADQATVGARLSTLLGIRGPLPITVTDALMGESSGKFRLCRPAPGLPAGSS